MGHTVNQNACGDGLAGVQLNLFDLLPSSESAKQESPVIIFDLTGECQQTDLIIISA